MKSSHYLRVFILIAAGYLLLLITGAEGLSSWIKPLLLPPLLLAVYFHTPFSSKRLMLAALTFSWAGDVILIFAPISKWYFITGLLAFLLAHLTYLMVFRKENSKLNITTAVMAGLIGIIGFLIGILSILLPHLGDLQIPVVVYACTICAMLASALMGFSIWSTPSNYWILGGAISFVLSDTILAFNKFHHPIEMASLMIMLSYLIAQYSITKGILGLQRSN